MKNVITIATLLCCVACGQPNTETATETKTEKATVEKVAGWKNFAKDNYTIQYPSDWTLDESGSMGTSFFLFSPIESETDKFKENINLLIQNLAGQNLDLDKYTAISEEQIKTLMQGAEIVESKRIKTGSDEYHKLIYSGYQEANHLQFEQYYRIIGDKAYILTFSSEKDKFASTAPLGEKIMNTFLLGKQ